MLENRNIAQEFAAARKSFINKQPDARPYNMHLGRNNQEVLSFLELHGIFPKGRLSIQQKKFPSGHKDILVMDVAIGYAIRDDSKQEGIKVMADSLVVNLDNGGRMRLYNKLYRQICAGNVSYETYKRGAYGVVGSHPKFTLADKEVICSKLCVKYFNYAFPFSSERWEQSIAVHDKVGEVWNLSGVTGLGNYIALRYLHEAGIPVPEVYLGTSELLIQQYIDGYTINDIKDRYEELKESGILGDDDAIIDGIWDFADEYIPKLSEEVQTVIEPIRSNYWAPDFQQYDINMGNIMITKKGLQDPAHNYYVIDPLR